MAGENRIDALCWYRPTDGGVWRAGWLRMWGTDSDATEEGPALFPVGVVEDDEHGGCHAVYVTRICFATVPPE